MSNRTIVEFNHDYTHKIDRDAVTFIRGLLNALRGGDRESWKALESFGVRQAIMAHHSDKRHVVVNERAYGFPGDLPPA